MIHAYTGKTGSGKTYQMIKDIYPHWYKGTDIYSNTLLLFENFGGKAGANIVERPDQFTLIEKLFEPLKKAYCKYRKKEYKPSRRGQIIYFEDITELIEIKNGIICMDEGQALLEARNWEQLPMEFANKLRQHRKHRLDLYVTTQNLGTIDINLRRLVQRWIHCKDIFALLALRNPSWLSLHLKELKDIDQLYNQVDDLQVEVLKSRYFIIHLFKKRYYDTNYDIGFTTIKSVWIQEKGKKKLLILPKNWSIEKGRTQLLLLKFYLGQNR